MKFLGIILSLYFLALMGAPCGDVITAEDEAHIENTQNQDNHDHNGLDLCSPFCQCQCCQVNLLCFEIQAFLILEPAPPSEDVLPFIGYFDIAPYPILQPPRV